jgi:hypothetical protein
MATEKMKKRRFDLLFVAGLQQFVSCARKP